MAIFDRFKIKGVAGAGLCGAAMALSPDAAAAPLWTGRLRAELVGADERTLQVNAEDSRFVDALVAGCMFGGSERVFNFFERSSHRRRQERRCSGARMRHGDATRSVARVHDVGAAAAMAVEVDKAGTDHAIIDAARPSMADMANLFRNALYRQMIILL